MTATTIHTLSEVAAEFRCGDRKIAIVAKANGIGMQLGGRAGWRFTDTDVIALREAMRPRVAAPMRRRKRAS
jgi:hypothetical protein